MAFGDEDERKGLAGTLGRHRGAVRVGAVGAVVLGVVAFLMVHTARQPPAPKPPTITMVMIQPPKPPPPPPPPPQQKTITPPKMTVPTAKPVIPNQPPKPAPPKAAAPAVTQLGTSIHNNGPADNFNLGGTPGGNGFGSGGGGGGGGSWQEVIQSEITEALQKNPRTRNVAAGLEVRLWVGGDGAVTRTELAESSGNAAVDNVIVNQILRNMRFEEPPPSGTPMPVLMKLTGQQPL